MRARASSGWPHRPIGEHANEPRRSGLDRVWDSPMRMAAALLSCVAGLVLAGPLAAQEITDAEYARPTAEYPHGVLGDDLEWKELMVTVTRTSGKEGGLFSGYRSLTYRIEAPDGFVFEDLAPRLWDVTGDGSPEVVIVQSHEDLGARLLIVGLVDGVPDYIAGTGHIGTRFRWLAPVGAADLDGDGTIEIAFVDRPHLARILRVWRYTADGFSQVARMDGISNHRIGEDFISGGVRDCGDGPELVVADADWAWVLAARLTDTAFTARRVAPFEGPRTFEAALACR